MPEGRAVHEGRRPEGTALHEGIFYPRTKKIRGRGGYSVVYSQTTPHIYNKYTTLFFLSFVNNSRTCYITYGSHLTHVQPFICPVSHIFAFWCQIYALDCNIYMPNTAIYMPSSYICPVYSYICTAWTGHTCHGRAIYNSIALVLGYMRFLLIATYYGEIGIKKIHV